MYAVQGLIGICTHTYFIGVDVRMKENKKRKEFLVIHPLSDKPEKKIDVDHAGKMKKTRTVKFWLFVLSLYVLMIVVLFLYDCIKMIY